MTTTWAYQSRIDPRKWWACDPRTAAEAVDEGYAVRLITFDGLLGYDTGGHL